MNGPRRKQLGMAILILTVMACNLFGPATVAPTVPGAPTDTPGGPADPTPTPPAGVYQPAFANYQREAVSLPASFSGYSLPVDLSTVEGLDRYDLTPTQLALLAQNGFVVAPPGHTICLEDFGMIPDEAPRSPNVATQISPR